MIHTPLEVGRFRWDADRDDVWLCLSRLVLHMRLDLLVQAFNRLGLPLLVVGDSPLSGICVSRPEDFGIAPVEAMAAGAPMIGLGRAVCWTR